MDHPLFLGHTHKPCLSIWLPRTMVLVVFYLQNRLCVNGEMLVPKGLLKSWGVGQNTFQNHSDSHWLHWLLLKLPILPLLGMTRVPPSILWTLTDPGFRKGPCSTEPWIEVPKCPSKLFPTCQVRVVRFYVSCLLLSSSPLLLLLLNRDPRRTVFSVGPQPRPSTPSVPCRTSTTTIPAQCSLPDLNHDHPHPVFPAGPQPRVSTPSVPCRTSCRKIWDKECAEES